MILIHLTSSAQAGVGKRFQSPQQFFEYVERRRRQWSRGSVLAFSTHVRGFKPGWSRWIFKGEKILSMPSFRVEVKPSVPCRRFAACERTLNGVEVISAKLLDNILAHSSHFRRWDLSRRGGRGGTWWWKVGTTKKKTGKAMASYP